MIKKIMMFLMLLLLISNICAEEELIIPGEAELPPLEEVVPEFDIGSPSEGLGIPLPSEAVDLTPEGSFYIDDSGDVISTPLILPEVEEKSNLWYYILGGIGLIILIFIGYKYYQHRKEQNEFSTNIENMNQSNQEIKK